MSASALRQVNANVNLAGRNAVVVGGTTGIGKGIALRLAKANVSVTIVGRNAEAGSEVVKEMQAIATDPSVKPEFKKLDAVSLKAARDFVNEYSQNNKKLDFLIFTQGIATLQGYTPTPEGIDEKLCLHYFSRVNFALRFMPLLESSDDARVMSVFAAGVHSPYEDYETDFDLKNTYSGVRAANAASMYNDIAVDMLSREHKQVSFFHVAPGFVNTNWGAQMPWYVKGLVRLIQPLGKSIHDAGEVLCAPLFDATKKHSGFHLLSASLHTAPATALHAKAAPVVWQKTLQLIDQALQSDSSSSASSSSSSSSSTTTQK